MNSTTIVVQLWRILCLCWVVLTGSLKIFFVSCGNNFLIICLYHCDTNNRTTLKSLSNKNIFQACDEVNPIECIYVKHPLKVVVMNLNYFCCSFVALFKSAKFECNLRPSKIMRSNSYHSHCDNMIGKIPNKLKLLMV